MTKDTTTKLTQTALIEIGWTKTMILKLLQNQN